jgi:hypothetical protein
MRDVQEVLRAKKSAVERVRREVEALRLVTLLLADDADSGWDTCLRSAVPAEETHKVISLCADKTEDSPAEISARAPEAAANDVRFARAKKISRQLRRIAEPLFGTLVIERQ